MEGQPVKRHNVRAQQQEAVSENLGNIHRYPPITLYPTLPFYNIIIIFDTVVTHKRNIEHETGLPYLQFCMNGPGFSPSRLSWPAYDGGRKLENISA